MPYILVGIIPVGGDIKLREQYPLVQSRCNYNVVDVYSIAEVVQDYYSTASINRDVDYVLPLPPSAAVCSFKAVIDDKRTIKGIVKEKREAKRNFDQAVAQGKTAVLLQQDHADVFRVSLGNIKPNTKISVYISFVSIIPHNGSSQTAMRITMPTCIASRYGVAPFNVPWAPKKSSNRFELTVAIQMNNAITSVSSPSHPIGLTLGCNQKELTGDYEPSKAFVHLSDAAFLDRDIVIVVSAQGLDVPRCTVERWLKSDGAEEATDAYALTLVPKFDLPALPRQEYIFLVDRSGSMRGGRINSVKAALQILLRSLPSRNTTFNIVSFGSSHNSLWSASQTYNEEAMETASRHVDTFYANYGGTEMRAAVEYAFRSRADAKNQSSSRPGEKVPTSVFVLTDGESWDLEGLVDCVSKNCEAAKDSGSLLRTFVLGVGNEVSTAMCDGIARAGRGTAVYVATGEKPDAKLMGLLKAARGGVIEDLSIDWTPDEIESGTLEDDFEVVDTPKPKNDVAPEPQAPLSLFDETHVEKPVEIGAQKAIFLLAPPPRIQQAPKSGKLPIPLYPGFRCSIFAIVKRASNPGLHSSQVKITGKVLGRDVMFQIPVVPVSVDNHVLEGVEGGKLLHTLAAKQLIQGFEDLAKTPENKAEIERLGKRYSLASSVTSFVAIDEGREVEAEVEVHTPQAEAAVVHGSGRGTQGDGGARRHRKAHSTVLKSVAVPSSPPLLENGYMMARYSTVSVTPPQYQQQTRATTATMRENIAQAVSQVEHLDSLQDRTETLAASAESFKKAANKSKGSGGLFGGFFRASSRASSSSLDAPSAPLPPPGGAASGAPAATTGRHSFALASFIRRSTYSADPTSTHAPQANAIAYESTPLAEDDSEEEFGQEEYSCPRPKSKRNAAVQSKGSSLMSLPKPGSLDGLERGRVASSSYPAPIVLFAPVPAAPVAPAPVAPVLALTVENLARAQKFNGSFPSTDRHLQFLFNSSPDHTKAQALPVCLASLSCAEDAKKTLWSTALTLACLEKTFKGDKDSWEMLAEKATDYILGVLESDCGLASDKAQAMIAELKKNATGLL